MRANAKKPDRPRYARVAACLLPSVALGTLVAVAVRAEDVAPLIPVSRAYLDQSALSHGGMEALQSLYGSGNVALWSRDGHETPQAQALLHELGDAESYGLESKE